MEIGELKQEADRTEQLLAQCDSEIIRLEGLIAFLEAGGSQIYDEAPPPVFEPTQYKIEQRAKYSSEIYKKSGQDFLEEFKRALKLEEEKLPGLVENYQKALKAYEKAKS